MSANETVIDVTLKAKADGLDQAGSQFDSLLDDLKKGVAEALGAGGADAKFITHVVDEFDRLKASLKETGATGDEVAEKIANLEQQLVAAAAAEERRIDQLRTAMTQALAEKDAEEEALTLRRVRRQEDQLYAEQEEMASRKRILDLQQEREMRQSVAQARQMSAEQRIEREVRGQGAYDPREEVERLRQVEQQTGRNVAGMKGYRGSIGDAALAFAYMADDAQYGLRGIMNNIPQLALMLGMGSGLAGVISVAAVAVNFLWEKFGGAKEAAKQTAESKDEAEKLAAAVRAAAAATSELFKVNFDQYLTGLREATDLWSLQKSHINEALGYQNELAKAEQAAAQAKLETERQTQLAGAKDDDERKRINAEFDLRKANLTQTGQAEAMQRALDAQKTSENSLRARIGDAEGAKSSAQQTTGNLNASNQSILSGIGQQSDQARRERERGDNEYLIKYQEREMQQRLERQQQRGDPTKMDAKQLDEFYNEQAKIEALQKSISDAYKKRDELNLTKDADKAAMESGKGVTFEQAKKEASDAGDNVSAAKYAEAERQLKDNAEAAVKASEAAAEADKKILELKEELRALEKKGVLLKAQQIAQQEEAAAANAKAAADQAAENQRADAEHLKKQRELEKKQREEQARKLENDALEMEGKGLFKDAAGKRNEAALLRLGDDATPEQKRRVELDNAARDKSANEKVTEAAQRKSAQNIGEQAGAVGGNLGEAGKALKAAADKLKDGATEAELEALINVFRDLAPELLAKFKGQDQRFSELLKQMEILRSQIKNMRS